jgi:type VI secretion system protein ImpF
MASNKNSNSNAVPSLLDRFSQQLPTESSNATQGLGDLPIANIEEAIVRDLNWLLTTSSLEMSRDLSRWPQIRKSVLNYGINVASGPMIGNPDILAIERSIKKSIEAFEPRLRPDSLRVEAALDPNISNHRQMLIRVTAQYIHQGQCLPIAFQAAIELESGRLQMVA